MFIFEDYDLIPVLSNLEDKYENHFGKEMPTYFMLSDDNTNKINKKEIAYLTDLVNQCIALNREFETGLDDARVFT